MDHGSLIAPLRQAHHDPAMYARLHKGAHGCLVPPHGAGPEGAIGIAKDRDREISGGPLGLARGAKGLEKELRQVAPPPNPEPRDGPRGASAFLDQTIQRLGLSSA
jgi:hypothetical protein